MFKRKRDLPKVYGFGPFLGPTDPWKTQNIAKNENTPRNYIFMTTGR